MTKQKACKQCNSIYEGEKCPECGSQEYTEEWKGKVRIFNPEQSEVAKNLKITKAKLFAIKTR
ncbi:MAG: transcription elongation factor subunit Spt4 [Nanoarchaeota archaeon]